MRTRPLVLALALLPALAATSRARDPDYDRVLEAYKAKRWKELDALSARFLKEKPDYEYAHSVRFMRADSLFKRKRYADSEGACREYLRLHPEAKYAARVRRLLVRCLNEQWRYGEALKSGAEGYERGVALEGLRRFDEAAAVYAAVEGEQAAYRLGVVRFRAREFDAAREALKAFLRRWPGSRYARLAKDYLFRIDPGFERIEAGVVRDYRGKYESDPRLAAVLEKLPALRAAALERIAAVTGLRRVPDTFLVRLADAGPDRSGLWAQVRTERVKGEARTVLVLRTEYLMVAAHDLASTLVHELYHCLQRERLGEAAHLETPKWMREGAALYVAGQGPERIRVLAAHVGADERFADPLERLVDGLGGRHTLEDYPEDVCAFLAVEERHGKANAAALLRELLETPDVEAAIEAVLGEDFGTFDEKTRAYTRRRVGPLLEPGRADLLEAKRRMRDKQYGRALELLAPADNVYAPVAAYYRAKALFLLGRNTEALAAARQPRFRKSTLLGSALLLELRILDALGHEDFEAAAARARLDLEPFRTYGDLRKLLERKPG